MAINSVLQYGAVHHIDGHVTPKGQTRDPNTLSVQ